MTELMWRTDQKATPARPGRRLREVLESGTIHAMPGAFNAMSARILEQAGIRCALLGGSAVSNTLLGLPDAEFLTLDQLATVCSFATSSVLMPIVVDADTGYGNAVNVTHTVHVFEKGDAAGIMIEDQVAPKRSGHIAGKQVVSTEEMVGKIKAAAAARDDPDFLIIARCDARATEGPDGAIARGNAYADAGADATFIDGAISHEELARFGGEIRSRYRIVNMGGSAKSRTTPKLPLEELQGMGYSLAVFGLQMARAAALGMMRFTRDLHARGIEADLGLLKQLEGLPIEDWYNYTGFDRIRAMEGKYLPTEAMAKYSGNPAAYYQPDSNR